jgi:hypothetical protein
MCPLIYSHILDDKNGTERTNSDKTTGNLTEDLCGPVTAVDTCPHVHDVLDSPAGYPVPFSVYPPRTFSIWSSTSSSSGDTQKTPRRVE